MIHSQYFSKSDLMLVQQYTDLAKPKSRAPDWFFLDQKLKK